MDDEDIVARHVISEAQKKKKKNMAKREEEDGNNKVRDRLSVHISVFGQVSTCHVTHR
ncbi:hypothetical protein MTR_5g084835 [Medicago truncatula]|uniref:Uncharacterized protein n=1 Tax=Medicago truncatula TaxID=3880 RepID=A0A072UEX5_MEDTR|nr:hypothetical protein MTR_5g084835 [Medicago truncatula]